MVSTAKIAGMALLLSLMPGVAFAINTAPHVLTVEADEWCPINCNPANAQQGVGIDLIKRVFEPMGYRIQYTIVPWTQALQDVRAGKVDMVVGANRHDDATLIFPDNAIFNMTDDFYVLPGDSWQFQGFYSLKGKSIGTVADYGYGDVVTQYVNQNKGSRLVKIASGTDALKDNMTKLASGEINILVESKPVIDYKLHQMGQEDKLVWAGGSPQDKVYVAFSPVLTASKSLSDQYDTTVRGLRERGELDALYGAYGLRP